MGWIAGTIEGPRGAVGQIDVKETIAIVVQKAGSLPVDID
jgi:hypothetical protein